MGGRSGKEEALRQEDNDPQPTKEAAAANEDPQNPAPQEEKPVEVEPQQRQEDAHKPAEVAVAAHPPKGGGEDPQAEAPTETVAQVGTTAVAPAPLVGPASEGGTVIKKAAAPKVKVVSLGSSFFPRMSIDRLNCSADDGKLPFDWISTRVEGLIHYLRNDFRDFFSFVTCEQVTDSSSVLYRDYMHAFWHENPTEVSTHEEYKRRIRLLMSINAREAPVLFVRSAATTDEVTKAEELLEVLTSCFGRGVCLLLIVDFQTQVLGAGIIANNPRLLTYSLAQEAHMNKAELPYEKPIRSAMEWMQNSPIDAMTFPDVATFAGFLAETHWGLKGLGGKAAFETDPNGSPSADVKEPSYEEIAEAIAASREASSGSFMRSQEYKGKSRNPLESEALELVHGVMPPAETITDGVTLVSLGCYCGTKLSFQKLGRGAATLPFDWIRTSHESLIHFLQHDFEGFYDVDSQQEVPGVPGMIMYRGQRHSFWHDDPHHPETREKYDRRIARFLNLGASSKIILCVRAIGTTDEINLVDELLTELKEKFGEKVCLCLVLSFQTSHKGAYFIDGNEDILAYFQNSSAFAGEKAQYPFMAAVDTALRWARGEAIEAGCVKSVAELAALADETHWGFVGLGGLPAFEDKTMQPRPRNPDSKADDNIEQVVAKVPQKYRGGKLVTE